MKIIISILTLLLCCSGYTQDSLSSAREKNIVITGYADVYFGYDFNNPAEKLRPSFLYNFKKHEQLNTNLALLKASYNKEKFKANVGIMTGTYAKFNLVAEPEFFRYIYEANIGFNFSEKFSVDAGILPSHIGCESAIAKDNWNLSRSLPAENSPYYETGIKFNYDINEKWKTSFLVLQGWQNIKDHNSSKAIGTQLQFIPNKKLAFNSSSFLGNQRPDSAKQLRLFHNFFVTYHLTDKIRTILVVDLGAERKIDKSGFNKWMGTSMLFQYAFAKKFAVAARGEFYRDKSGVIVSTYLPSQFETTGISLNLDYFPAKTFSIRTELRSFHSKNKIFFRNNIPVQSNFSLLASAALWF